MVPTGQTPSRLRKGEHGSLAVSANTITKTETDENGEDVEREIPFMDFESNCPESVSTLLSAEGNQDSSRFPGEPGEGPAFRRARDEPEDGLPSQSRAALPEFASD
jgi:hypothetical protein